MSGVKLNQKERKALLYIKKLLCRINNNKIRGRSRLVSDTFDIFSGYIQELSNPKDKKLFHYKTGVIGRHKYKVPVVNKNKKDDIDILFEKIFHLLMSKEQKQNLS